MKKDLYVIEALNVVSWYRQLTPEKLNKLDFKIRWSLKKAVAKLTPDAAEFEKMRDEEVKQLQEKWFTSDEKSEITNVPVLDNDGNEVKDEEGIVQTQEVRKVKEEFMDEYQGEVHELQDKLNEILYGEKNTYEYNSADIDTFVQNLEDPSPLDFSDLELLDALLTDNGEV